MTAPVFPLLQEDAAAYVAGIWRGYVEAIATQLKAPSQTIAAMGGNWKGRRADLFDAWWGPASGDVATLGDVAQMMADGFGRFAAGVPDVNLQLAEAGALVLANTRDDGDGRYAFKTTTDGSHTETEYVLQITGLDIEVHGPPFMTRPAWLTGLYGHIRGADAAYTRAAGALRSAISAAPGMLQQMSQLKELPKGSPALDPEGAFASLNDPTWKQLTGGDTFRPNLPPGFRGDPFSKASIPSWYQPSVLDKIFDFIGDHLGDLVNVASLAFALAGLPELSLVLETGASGYQTIEAAAHHDWAGVGLGALGLVIGVHWGSESIDSFLEHFSLGDQFGKAIAGAFEKSEQSIAPEVADSFGSYVQDHVEDYIKAQLKDLGADAHSEGTKVTVPPGVLQQIFANAAQQIGIDGSRHAAGLPAA